MTRPKARPCGNRADLHSNPEAEKNGAQNEKMSTPLEQSRTRTDFKMNYVHLFSSLLRPHWTGKLEDSFTHLYATKPL